MTHAQIIYQQSMLSLGKSVETILANRLTSVDAADARFFLLGSPLFFYQDKCTLPQLLEQLTVRRINGICHEAAWHYQQLESFFCRHKSAVKSLYLAIEKGDIQNPFDLDGIRRLEEKTNHQFLALIAINGLIFWENPAVNTYTPFNTSDFETIKNHLVSMTQDYQWQLQGWLGLAQFYAYHASVDDTNYFLEADNACKQVLSLEPESLEIAHWVGNIFHLIAKRSWHSHPSQAKGYFNSALEEYTKMLAEYPEHAKAWFDLARLLNLKPEHLETAEYAYQRALAIEISNDHLDAYAAFLIDQQRYSEALKHLHDSLAITPENITALNYLGDTYGFLNRWTDAEGCYAHLLSLKPDANLVIDKHRRAASEAEQQSPKLKVA